MMKWLGEEVLVRRVTLLALVVSWAVFTAAWLLEMVAA